MNNTITKKPWLDEAILPEGYGLDERGLWWLRIEYNASRDALEFSRIYLSFNPIWMVSNAQCLDSDNGYIVVRHLVNEAIKEQIIYRKLLYQGNLAGELGGKFGFYLNPGCVGKFSNYLLQGDMICMRTESYRERTGWIQTVDGKKFSLYQDNGILIKPKGDNTSLYRGICQRGDKETYLQAAINMLVANPLACVPFAGSLAAPLLSIVHADSTIIDICDSSSKGKTVSAENSIAVWGDPHGLVTQWDSTMAGLDGSLELFGDVPVVLDDAQNQTDRKIIGSIIYRVGNCRARQKGRPHGGIKEAVDLSTIVISTSETSILSLSSKQFSGQNARVIPVSGDTLGNYSGDDVRELEDVLEENHGWVGRDVIDHLESHADHKAIHEQQKLYRKMLLESVADDDRIQERRANTYAVLLCAIDILKDLYPSHLDSIIIIGEHLIDHWHGLCSSQSGHANVQKAMSILIDHYNKSPHHFDGTSKTCKGVLYKPHGTMTELIGFYPTEFEKIMKTAGFSSENILKEFMDRDWILYQESPKRRKRIHLTRTKRGNYEIKLIVISKSGRDAYESDFS